MSLRKMGIVLLLSLCITCACGQARENNTIQREVLQVTDETRYTQFIAEETEIKSDIVYATAEGYDGQNQDLALDIYTPKGDEETARPAILWVHGGGYTGGDKAGEGLLKYLATDFARMGYVSVVPNYRLGKEASLADVDRAVEDIKVAYEWVCANGQNYGIDVENIALAGYSSGGGIVQNLCYSDLYDEMDKTRIFAVVSICGEGLHHSETKEAAPPCLIIHGTADTTVKYKLSEKFFQKLSKKGISCELYPLEGLNHTLLTRYEGVRNKIGSFLYERLTGKEHAIDIVSEVSVEYRNVLTRQENGIEYQVETVMCQVDGKLNEWEGLASIEMNQLKDAGDAVPSAQDYEGRAMVGRNPKEPKFIYIAAEVTDDVYQDIVPTDGKWYNDDCLEIVFDLSEDGVAEQFLKYVVGAGEDLSVLANNESVQAVVIRDGNKYYYEMAIDLSALPEGTLQRADANMLLSGQSVGFSIAYNDSDGGNRETQIGWIAGKTSDRTCFGNLMIP